MSEYTTPESLAALSVIDPEIESLVLATPSTPNRESTIEDIRNASAGSAVRIIGNVSRSQVQKIPMRDGYASEIRIYRPENPRPREQTPLVVLIYGGGFILGDNKQLNAYARAISTLFGATVVSISYRLAPEYKFPIAAYDCWDSLCWIAKHAAEMGADPTTGFILGGVSAGGNLAAVTGQKSIAERFHPPLTGLWLGIPFILDETIVPAMYKSLFVSRVQNREALILNGDSVRNTYDLVGFDVLSPDFSPFNFPGAHIGMPPTYFQVAGADPLRDDGLIYERVLREHGVPTRLSVYPGGPHGHYSAWPDAEISRKWDFDVIDAFGWLLGRSVNPSSIRKARDERNCP